MAWDDPSKYGGGSFPKDVSGDSKIYFVDGDHTAARPISVPMISYPFEGDSHAPTMKTAVLENATNPTGKKYVLADPDPTQSNENPQAFMLEQRFRIAAQWFTPQALDSSYDRSWWDGYQGALDLDSLILIAESPTQEVAGGQLEWVRTYATVPPTRNTYESFQFTFPGIDPDKFGTNSNDSYSQIPALTSMVSAGGPILQDSLLARVEHKFFLVPGGLGPVAFSPDYTDPASDFYVVPKFKVFYGNFFNEVPYLFDGDIQDFIDWIDKNGDDSTPPAQNTIPPKTTGAVGNDADCGTGYDQMIGVAEICVKASVIRPWRGNIYEKVTIWSVAQ